MMKSLLINTQFSSDEVFVSTDLSEHFHTYLLPVNPSSDTGETQVRLSQVEG